jgi:hypothetical protein
MLIKNIGFILLAILAFTESYAQNTFPTSGNVGINTQTPSERLDVNGNLVVDSCLRVKDSVLIDKDLRTKGKFIVEDNAFFLQAVYMNDKLIVGSDVTSSGKIEADGNIKSGNNVIATNNLKANNNVVASNNVNVGNKINVTGTANLSGLVKMTGLASLNNLNNPNIELIFKTSSGNLKTYGFQDFLAAMDISPNQEWLVCDPVFAAAPYWIQAANKLYTVCPEVFVGINTSNPFHLLHVAGTAFSENILVGNKEAPKNAMMNGYVNSNSKDLFELGKQLGSGASSILFKIANNGDVKLTNVGSENSLTINNGTGHAMVVYASDGSKILQVEDGGLLRSRYIRVDQNIWADYVFSEEYVLMSLSEVEKYIQSEGHLPKIPSSDEIEKEGLDLGEMQSLQMEKIEEMYLHMIEMEKKINSLEEDVKELKNENDQFNNK